jgi:hypothetical protein
MTRPAANNYLDLVDVYGADQSRWPAAAVRRFTELTSDDAMAAAVALREAKSLEQVLQHASMVPVGRQAALADRIMTAVLEDARKLNAATDGGHQPVAAGRDASILSSSPVSSSPGNVIALPTRETRQVNLYRHRGIDWRAAAALAAALVLGIGVGMTGTASPTFQAVAETVGVSLDRSVLAFNDEQVGSMTALDDEDSL